MRTMVTLRVPDSVGSSALSPTPFAEERLPDDCFVGDDSQFGRAVPGSENAVGFFSAGRCRAG